jgi:hypothetical protein
MSDIVERLREVTSQTLTSECHQAADEIARLRELLTEAWHQHVGDSTGHGSDLWDRVREALGDD